MLSNEVVGVMREGRKVEMLVVGELRRG